MALSADKIRQYGTNSALTNHTLATQAQGTATTIYEGGAVSQNAGGYAVPLAGTDPAFLGFAAKKSVNDGADGAVRVELIEKGHVELDVVGAAVTTDNGVAVYATDDNTFTLTSTGALRIGSLSRWIGADGYGLHVATTCLVYFEAHGHRVTGT